MNLNLVVIAMILALLIPLYEAWQNHDMAEDAGIWQYLNQNGGDDPTGLCPAR